MEGASYTSGCAGTTTYFLWVRLDFTTVGIISQLMRTFGGYYYHSCTDSGADLVQLGLPVVPARGGAEVALKIYIYIKPFSSIELACAVRQPSPCVRAFCESGVLFPMSHVKLHFALHTSRWTLHTPPTHFTLHTSHFTLHSSHSTLHTSHFTLHTPHFTLHTPHFTVHTSHFKNTTKNSCCCCCCVQEHDLRATPVQRRQLSSKHFPHTSHCILENFTLHTSHLHFISTHLIWDLLISFHVFPHVS